MSNIAKARELLNAVLNSHALSGHLRPSLEAALTYMTPAKRAPKKQKKKIRAR